MHCQASYGAAPHDEVHVPTSACLSTLAKDGRPSFPIETKLSSFRPFYLRVLPPETRIMDMSQTVQLDQQFSRLSALLETSRLASGGLRPWLVLKPLFIDGPCAIEQVAVLLDPEEDQVLLIHGVEKLLESQQVPGPLVCPALQAGHDGAIRHGQKLYVVCTDAKGPEGIQAVDHIDRVATGADHAGKVVLVLGEVVDGEAARLDLPLHVGDDVIDSPPSGAVHVVREDDDVSDSCACGVFVVGDDVGYVCLQDVSRLGRGAGNDLNKMI